MTHSEVLGFAFSLAAGLKSADWLRPGTQTTARMGWDSLCADRKTVLKQSMLGMQAESQEPRRCVGVIWMSSDFCDEDGEASMVAL